MDVGAGVSEGWGIGVGVGIGGGLIPGIPLGDEPAVGAPGPGVVVGPLAKTGLPIPPPPPPWHAPSKATPAIMRIPVNKRFMHRGFPAGASQNRVVPIGRNQATQW